MSLALKRYQRRALDRLAAFFEAARRTGPAKAFASSADTGLPADYKPMPGLPEVPYACLRIPTGGGKTVMGAHIIRSAGQRLLDRELPLVLWMVPSTQIKVQTLDAFRDPRHPYRRELDDAFGGHVAVFDIADFAQIRPSDIATRVCIVVSTTASFRVDDKTGRKVYQHHEDLESHFAVTPPDSTQLDAGQDGRPLASFANVLKLHGPLAIVDEAHNFITDLSYEVHQRIGPRTVVELTATPDLSSSNVLVSVSAFELKAEDMIKFPVVLKEHADGWQAAVSNAVARRKALARIASGEPEYIRPILLVQAENARGAATVAEVQRHLVESEGVDPGTIAVATGDQRGIDGLDLFARDCPIEVIITKQALKEGWDCSFAYVFCSVAQVKSDKDIQQLLGRVLRMPYAKRRTQDAMNKAYAYVVSDSFGRAAGELTSSLVSIGFNPIEAAMAIRAEPDELPLTGGQFLAPATPISRIEVRKAPDLSSVPDGDRARVIFTPNATGGGGVVEIHDEIQPETRRAIVETAPPAKREGLDAQVERHLDLVAASKAPSERGIEFRVPRLYAVEQGELALVDRGLAAGTFSWDLLAGAPPDLTSFRINDDSMSFEVSLDGKGVSYRRISDDSATYLPGFAIERSESDLVGWLDQQIRDPAVRQPVLREWLRRAVHELLERGFSLAQLLKAQYVLRRKLEEQLFLARDAARQRGFQQALFGDDLEIVASDGPDHAFCYPMDMALYPAHSYYRGAYRFRKHYYPVPGDLSWKTPGGQVGEEFLCAQQIDLIEAIDCWVRNLVHPSQFWMPTSRQRTYPDFVAKLKDGRLLVVEYKGGDRFSSDQEREKRLVGDLWAKRSGGKGLYLMAQRADDAGNGVRDQLLAVISGK